MQGSEEEQTVEHIDDIEVYASDVEMYLDMFCKECTPPIEDMSKETQSRWNAALMYIRRHLFPDTSIFKLSGPLEGYINNNCDSSSNVYRLNNSNCNAYDVDKLNVICDCYIYLCMMYDKEVSINGFTFLTGISDTVIYEWAADDSRKLSCSGSVIYKKLRQYREESLSAKLATANKNPVGILAILNRHYQWNMPGVREQKQEQRLASREELGLEAPKERPALPGTGGND